MGLASLVVSVVVTLGVGVSLPPSTNAGARMVAIHGDLRCSVGQSQLKFDPPLVIVHNGDRRTKSRDTFTSSVTGCRGSTPTSAAPGGITSGVMELKGRLRQNNCVDLSAPGSAGVFLDGRQLLRVTWYDASGRRVGRNRYWAVPAGLTLIFDNFANNFPVSPIATVPLTSTVRSTAKAFGGEAVSTRVPLDLTDFSVRCVAGPVVAVPLLGGDIAIGNPT